MVYLIRNVVLKILSSANNINNCSRQEDTTDLLRGGQIFDTMYCLTQCLEAVTRNNSAISVMLLNTVQ